MTEQPTTVWHDVYLSGTGREYLAAQQENIYMDFSATWQRRPVVVRMKARRYVYSGGEWSDWSIYADTAREDTGGQGLGANLTDTARTRLGQQYRPAVEAWIRSKAYRDSEAHAYVRAI